MAPIEGPSKSVAPFRSYYSETGGAKEMKYAVIYEKSSNGWGAFVPDLPGCVALGFTLEETEELYAKPSSSTSRRCARMVIRYLNRPTRWACWRSPSSRDKHLIRSTTGQIISIIDPNGPVEGTKRPGVRSVASAALPDAV